VESAVIRSLTAEPFETPLHHPFVTSQGRADTAKAVCVNLELEDGRSFRGESVPVTYVTGETMDSVPAVCADMAPHLVGLDAGAYREIFDLIKKNAPDSPSARCAVEMAVFDAFCSQHGISLHSLLGGAKASVDTDITIPILPNAGELAELAWSIGIRVFKIKVGDKEPGADLERIRTIRSAAPEARLRIDANQAFSAGAAVEFVSRLVDEGAVIELLEQPVLKEDFDGLNWVAERSPAPVFADESCRTPADALKLVTTTAVHGLNLKINKNGITGVLDIIPIAKAAGRKLMLGCMLETRRSIAVSAAIACGTGAFDFLDLDSHLLLDEPGPNSYFDQTGPTLTLRSG
jgi:L-alanine-DL-glutamate epimerase-like enolase superfamily enzyme